MLNTRKFQTIGVLVLIVAAAMVTLSAVRLPAPAFVPITGINPEGLAQYLRSERSLHFANQNGLDVYHQSERIQSSPVANDKSLAISNEAGLAQYHRSEWSASQANQSGLNLYHQSERVNAYPAVSNEKGLAQYHQSERASFKAADGMAIYHQSERGSFKAADGMTIYHQSEWFGK